MWRIYVFKFGLVFYLCERVGVDSTRVYTCIINEWRNLRCNFFQQIIKFLGFDCNILAKSFFICFCYQPGSYSENPEDPPWVQPDQELFTPRNQYYLSLLAQFSSPIITGSKDWVGYPSLRRGLANLIMGIWKTQIGCCLLHLKYKI